MNKFLKVLIKPSEVFREEKEKASVKKALITFLIISFLVGMINLVGFFLNPQSVFLLNIINLILPIKLPIIQSLIAILYLVFLPIISVVIVLLFSLFGFAISRFFGGIGDYRTFLYFASIYYVPLGLITAIFSQIPGIGQYIAYIIITYTIYPFTVALKESFNLSVRKAFAVWLIPTLIVLPIISYPILKDWYQQYKAKRMWSEAELMIDAIKSDNLSLCKSIKTSSMRNNCIAIINRTPTGCSGQQHQIDSCFKDIAKKTNNADLCLSIQSSNTRIECVTEIAITTKDRGLCNKLSGELDKRNWSERRECFYRVGINLKDVSACSLTDEDRRITCTAIAENDISICSQLKESYEIQSCEAIFRNFLKK